MTVSGAGFDKPAVETTLPWTYVCGTPCGVISGLSSPTRGPKSLESTADANVSLSYPPSEALQLVSILVACILFVHHMFPRKLPYPSACCLYCPITVCDSGGSRDQHQVAALSRQGTVAHTVVVGHLLTS